MEKIIVDADGAIVGRMGSFVAKELLRGKSAIIVNSEKAVISGRQADIIGRISNLIAKGGSSQKGPHIRRVADRFLKRMIRGMLPWKKERGKSAYKRLKCYIGTEELTDEEKKQVIKLGHDKPIKYMTIEQILKLV